MPIFVERLGISGLVGIAFILLLVLLIRQKSTQDQPVNLPPSPRAKFLIGNLLDLPPKGPQEWQHWLKWKEFYGNVAGPVLLMPST